MKALVLGGTGTLGGELTKQILRDETSEVTIYSRCELKQKEMSARVKDSRVHFFVGDIRDRLALFRVCKRAKPDVIFHVAALKHVDTMELFPEESVKTNIEGTINAADAAESYDVPHFVFSSTDKAVDPINVYGMSKGIAERILLQRNLSGSPTRYSVFRWGNVIGSRGSAVPLWVKSLKESAEVSITDPEMTRFWIRIEEACDFMLRRYPVAPTDSVILPPIKASSVERVIEALTDLLKIKEYKKNYIGIRPGEKLHEVLQSQHDLISNSSKTATQLTLQELYQLLGDQV